MIEWPVFDPPARRMDALRHWKLALLAHRELTRYPNLRAEAVFCFEVGDRAWKASRATRG